MTNDPVGMRESLKSGERVSVKDGQSFVIDEYLSCGGFSLLYLAHMDNRDKTPRYVVLKELFPQNVNRLITERDQTGKVVIRDQITGDPIADGNEIWKDLNGCFEREADLTRRACAVFDAAGNETHQNNPDVMNVFETSFVDTLRHNRYIALDTFRGKPLRALIEHGFERNGSGCVVSNNNLEEILDVLVKTALRLSRLHADNMLLHLDLSADNIYVAETDAGTTLTPHIIDYGSAFDINDQDEYKNHIYTSNLFSAPEITALAEFNDADCGYRASAASDTYSLASILFYAMTGTVFEPEMQLFDSGWQRMIRKAYPDALHSDKKGRPLADSFIAFFKKGLAAAQEDRFKTADELYRELEALSVFYKKHGGILSIEPDELVSFAILDKHPLYEYISSDGNFHVLCIGFGTFVRNMILALISTGQMISSKLFIHIVSSEPVSALRDYVAEKTPELLNYSDGIDDEGSGSENGKKTSYVTFTYTQVADVFNDAELKTIVNTYSDARYVIISLGTNAGNINMAYAFGKALTESEATHSADRPTIINYYASEDAAANRRSTASTFETPEWLRIEAFGSSLSEYRRTINALTKTALRLAYLYDKLYEPRRSFADTAKSFIGNVYDQKNSFASGVHLKYKLAALDISPKGEPSAVIAEYTRKLPDHRSELLELEHRRWLMYMISIGYTHMTSSEMENFGFNYVVSDDGSFKFNKAWKCTAKNLHHCIVPCSGGGLMLKTMDHTKWDSFTSEDEIDGLSDLDELDKISLKAHLIAKKKIDDIIEKGKIENIFRDIENKLRGLLSENDKKQYDHAHDDILAQVRGRQYRDTGSMRLLEDAVISATGGINSFGEIMREIKLLKETLLIFTEFSNYKDYKLSDCAIAESLLWILHGGDSEITLVKLYGRTISDNITSALLIDPQELIFAGADASVKCKYEKFFTDQGRCIDISCVPIADTNLEGICSAVERLVSDNDGGRRYVLDITGADELMTCAAIMACRKNEDVSIIRSTADPPRIENIFRFYEAPIYNIEPSVSAEEIYSLYEASALDDDRERNMLRLKVYADALWEVYNKHKLEWNDVTAFFANKGIPKEMFFKNIDLSEPDVKNTREHTAIVNKNTWDGIKANEVFEELNKCGFISGYSRKTINDGEYEISFKAQDENFITTAFNRFFNGIENISLTLKCGIRQDQENGLFSIQVDNGVHVNFNDEHPCFKDLRNETYSNRPIQYSDIIKPLDSMKESGLISGLNNYMTKKGKWRFDFIYSDAALRDCLSTAGTVLELYVWNEAVQSGYFEDARPNFYFQWKSEKITNEIDVILTKGLTSLIISCKTAKFNKEHLYEISTLTRQFSMNSKPVIVYSSASAIDDENHITSDLSFVKDRARSMGIYLIDLNELDANNIRLRDMLVDIAEGRAAL